LALQFFDPMVWNIHVNAHKGYLECKSSFIEIGLVDRKLYLVQLFLSQHEEFRQLGIFLFLGLFSMKFFMDSQLNFKTSHQLVKILKHIHFIRKSWKNELRNCKVWKKTLFLKFQFKYI